MTRRTPRTWRRVWRAAGVAPALVALSAWAQPPGRASPPTAPEAGAPEVSEIIVRPGKGGPAWWTVSKGDRQALILGVPWSFPADEAWSQTALRKNLDDSDLVFLPPILSGVVYPRSALVATSPLPAATAERLRRAALAIGQPADRYAGLTPFAAGELLVTDFRDSLGLRSGVIGDTVAHAAQLRKRRAVYAAVMPADPDAAPDAAFEAAGQACLDAALAEVEAGPAVLRKAVKAWVDGEVRTALAAPSGMETCGLAVPGVPDLRARTVRDQVTVISDALEKPAVLPKKHKVVVLVNLQPLLASGGVIEQLHAKGYRIEAPAY